MVLWKTLVTAGWGTKRSVNGTSGASSSEALILQIPGAVRGKNYSLMLEFLVQIQGTKIRNLSKGKGQDNLPTASTPFPEMVKVLSSATAPPPPISVFLSPRKYLHFCMDFPLASKARQLQT